MSTMTATAPAVKGKKKQRTLSYNALVGALHVTQEGKEYGYWLDSLAHDFGPSVRAFRVTKILGKPGEPDHYDVTLSDAGDTCECKGFIRWGRCKHTGALRCLVRRGTLS